MKLSYTALATSVPDALSQQNEMRNQLVISGEPKKVDLIAAVDVSFDSQTDMQFGTLVIWDRQSQTVVEKQTSRMKARFPYISGLLAYRELPALLPLFEQLTVTPDIILCDGQGIAHPRGFGLACHLGLILGIPSIGCAKTRLVGEYRPVGTNKGERSPLFYKGSEVGMVLRTRTNVAPLFISPGHLCSIDSAVEIILKHCLTRYRLPEPSRLAHLLSKAEFRRG